MLKLIISIFVVLVIATWVVLANNPLATGMAYAILGIVISIREYRRRNWKKEIDETIDRKILLTANTIVDSIKKINSSVVQLSKDQTKLEHQVTTMDVALTRDKMKINRVNAATQRNIATASRNTQPDSSVRRRVIRPKTTPIDETSSDKKTESGS